MRWAKGSARFFALFLALLRWHKQRGHWPILMRRQRCCTPVGSRSTYCGNVVAMLLPRLISPPPAELSGKDYRTSWNWWRELRPSLWLNFGRAHQIRQMPKVAAIKQALGPHKRSFINKGTKDKEKLGPTGCYASLRQEQTRRFGTSPNEGGEVSLLLLSCACIMVCICAITMWAWITKAAQYHLALFDDERHSPLYCSGPLTYSFDGLAPVNKSISAFADKVPCVLRRTDYAAPGTSLEQAPEILCLLLKRMNLSTVDSLDAGVGPCA